MITKAWPRLVELSMSNSMLKISHLNPGLTL